MRRLAITAALCAALSGCTVGPDYVKPQVDTPERFRFEDQQAQDTANTQWWKQFDDPVLDELIVQALAGNKNVQIAAANVEQAAALLTQARSQFYPQVGYGGSAARQRDSESGAPPVLQDIVENPRNTYQVLASASWEIDLWGRVRRLSEAARAQLLATEQARRGVILSLVAQTASIYLQLRGLDAQLTIAKQTQAAYAETLKLFELRFKYGQMSQMNVEQARSRYEAASVQIPQIETAIAQAENALSILLGRNPQAIVRGKSIDQLAVPVVPAGIPSEVLTRRPDIAQAEQSLIAANAQIGAAKALYFPTLSLTGAFGASSAELSDLFKGPARVWSYSGSITGPIFTGGAIGGQVAQARAAQNAALLSYQSVIQSAFADVDNALIAKQKLVEQLAAQARLVRADAEYERLARMQYEGGYTPYSTVLQAQQELFPEQLNLVQTRYALYNALVNVYKAMGGGWVTLAEKQTLAQPPLAASTDSGTAPAPSTPAAAKPEGANKARQLGDTSVVNIQREAGVGGARINAPKSGWPPAVVVRLHGFTHLSTVRARSNAGAMDCIVAGSEGPSRLTRCTMGGAAVDGLRAEAGYFEVRLPGALLGAEGGPVELRWTDQR